MKNNGYLVQANEEYRRDNFSGAVHRVILEKIIRNGGYVCIPIIDPSLSLKYVCTKCINDLDKMVLPVIVYIDESLIIEDIKEKLKLKCEVAFVGLPCQVNRIGTLFEKNDKMTCLQLSCGGVMSQKVFLKYLEQFDEKIKEIKFSDNKKYFFHDNNLNIKFEDGTYFRQFKNKNRLLLSVSNGMSVLEKCVNCDRFFDGQYADFILGDLCECFQWETVGELAAINDQLGTNYIQLLSDKSINLFDQIRNNCQTIVELDDACIEYLVKTYIDFACIEKRDRFLYLLNLSNYDFDKAFDYALYGKYDIAINGDWTDYNYGAVLTAVALYWIVEDMGFSAILVQYGIRPTYNSKVLFSMTGEKIWNNIEISKDLKSTFECEEIDTICDIYLLGSDINWRSDYMFTGSYLAEYFGCGKKKIAYSTSIGEERFMGTSIEKKEAKDWIEDFSGVAVREKSAVGICEDSFEKEAVHVLDPVMLVDLEKYIELSDDVELSLPKKYLVFYKAQLDPYNEQYKCAEYIAEKYGLSIVVIENPANNQGENNKHYTVDEFIYIIRNAEYFIGGSFHGACFSILFHVPFSIIVNPVRGPERLKSLVEDFGFENRIVYDYDLDLLKKTQTDKDIDWKKVDDHLFTRREFSYKWLKKQLYSKENKENVIVGKWMKRMVSKIKELENELQNGKNERIKGFIRNSVLDNSKVVIRGAGSETRKYSSLIADVFNEKNIDMIAVVDGNTENSIEFNDRIVYAVSSSDISIYNDCDYIIVISSRHHKEMVIDMVRSGVPREKIIDFSEFLSFI